MCVYIAEIIMDDDGAIASPTSLVEEQGGRKVSNLFYNQYTSTPRAMDFDELPSLWMGGKVRHSSHKKKFTYCVSLTVDLERRTFALPEQPRRRQTAAFLLRHDFLSKVSPFTTHLMEAHRHRRSSLLSARFKAEISKCYCKARITLLKCLFHFAWITPIQCKNKAV